MEKYFKYLFVLLLVCFIVPQIAFASWWNPLSWNVWNYIFPKHITVQQIKPTTQIAPDNSLKTETTDNSNNQTEEVAKTSASKPLSNNQAAQTQPQPSKKVQTPATNSTPNQNNTTPPPQITQNTTPSACTPDWQCSSWDACSGSLQKRICVDVKNCGSTADKPAIMKDCVVVACVPNWQCDDWSACSNSQQTRNCNDLNNCGDANGQPTLSKPCTPAPTCSLSLRKTVDGTNKYVIAWNSSNATNGELSICANTTKCFDTVMGTIVNRGSNWLDVSQDIVSNGVAQGNTVAMGYSLPVSGFFGLVSGLFEGSGGTGTCQMRVDMGDFQ
jgi:hypothetical protein